MAFFFLLSIFSISEKLFCWELRKEVEKEGNGMRSVFWKFAYLISLAESEFDKLNYLLKFLFKLGSLQLTAAFAVMKGRD